MTHITQLRATPRPARSRQRGIGLLAIVVSTLVMLSLSAALVSRMRTGSAVLEGNFNDTQRATAAVAALRAALAECSLNYPVTVNSATSARATYVLFDAAAANTAGSAGTLPATVPADVPVVDWPTRLFCPGRSSGGTAPSLWAGANAAFPVPSATRLSLSLRMGQASQAVAQRPGSLYLVVNCGTATDPTVPRSLLDNLGVASAGFACGAAAEVLLAP